MDLEKDFPSVTKYMGSKTDVLDLIEKGLNYFDHKHEWVCDLFAGSATLSGALRNKANVISNDVQKYSEVFATTYLSTYDWNTMPDVKEITRKTEERVSKILRSNPELANAFRYDREFTLEEFNKTEEEERRLIDRNNWDDFDGYYLFTKDYSGTYWSYEQCVWIDSYRAVIDEYKDNKPAFSLLLTCLIYAMAYNSQSTGHYAQYRVPETDSSKEDILLYRRKCITDFFERKYYEFRAYLNAPNYYKFITTCETDVECLKHIPENTLVYADPPYCFVHFSRFYHVLETLVKYDYPRVRFKGRYRTDRYQSEYCVNSKVADAFSKMFREIRNKNADMVLSYTNSDTNTINFNELLMECCNAFNPGILDENELKLSLQRSEGFFEDGKAEEIKLLTKEDVKQQLHYEIAMVKKPYNHSRMGRTRLKTIPVTEVVIIAKKLDLID